MIFAHWANVLSALQHDESHWMTGGPCGLEKPMQLSLKGSNLAQQQLLLLHPFNGLFLGQLG